MAAKSRLARALWIEGFTVPVFTWHVLCRGSREPCGSKAAAYGITLVRGQSRLARALWIEG